LECPATAMPVSRAETGTGYVYLPAAFGVKNCAVVRYDFK